MILISKYLIPKGYSGLTLYPFVFLKHSASRMDAVLINHERIHLRQQLEMGILPFYVCYVVAFFVRYIQYRDWYLAYINISFEKECYHNEANLNYLDDRKFWSFLKYLRKNDGIHSAR